MSIAQATRPIRMTARLPKTVKPCDIADHEGSSPAKVHQSFVLPFAKQPTHGTRGHGGHLGQQFLGNADFHTSVYPVAYLMQQTNQRTGQTGSNRCRGYFAEAAF